MNQRTGVLSLQIAMLHYGKSCYVRYCCSLYTTPNIHHKMKPPETFGPIFDVAHTKKIFHCVKNWIFKVCKIAILPDFQKIAK